jgi:hypothetical protein
MNAPGGKLFAVSQSHRQRTDGFMSLLRFSISYIESKFSTKLGSNILTNSEADIF